MRPATSYEIAFIDRHNDEILRSRAWLCQVCEKPAKEPFHSAIPRLNPGEGATAEIKPFIWDTVIPICMFNHPSCDPGKCNSYSPIHYPPSKLRTFLASSSSSALAPLPPVHSSTGSRQRYPVGSLPDPIGKNPSRGTAPCNPNRRQDP